MISQKRPVHHRPHECSSARAEDGRSMCALTNRGVFGNYWLKSALSKSGCFFPTVITEPSGRPMAATARKPAHGRYRLRPHPADLREERQAELLGGRSLTAAPSPSRTLSCRRHRCRTCAANVSLSILTAFASRFGVGAMGDDCGTL